MPKADGELVTLPWDSDRATTEKTVQCVHCGAHHVIKDAFVQASLGKLGFCGRCNGITCGRSECEACVPIEQQLENMEAGRLDINTYRPVRVSFSLPEGSNDRVLRS